MPSRLNQPKKNQDEAANTARARQLSSRASSLGLKGERGRRYSAEALCVCIATRIAALVCLRSLLPGSAGQYRRVPVRISGAAHTPPDAWELTRLMNEWGDWLNGAADSLHAVERAAVAHHRLLAIHPFIDGNGRTARLVMNLLLMRLGYPPTIIQKINRKQYYRVLAQADKGNAAPIVNFVGRAVEAGLTLYLEAITPQINAPEDADIWIPLREAAKQSAYSQEYLSLLARKGRLEALKRGRNWFTTMRALAAYTESVADG